MTKYVDELGRYLNYDHNISIWIGRNNFAGEFKKIKSFCDW